MKNRIKYKCLLLNKDQTSTVIHNGVVFRSVTSYSDEIFNVDMLLNKSFMGPSEIWFEYGILPLCVIN